MKRKLLFGGIVILILLQSLVTVYAERDKFFSRGYEKNYASLTEKYNKSQYHQKKNPVSMSDADFEQFAGGIFLKGLNPILIVHDHPPLGRYVVSLSILLFDNPHTIMLPILALIIISMFLLSNTVIKNPFLALIPVALFCNEQMFVSRIVQTPLPEPIQLPFILFAFYFFIRGFGAKKDIPWFIFCSLMLGGVISTRFFILGAAMTGSMGLYLLLTHRFDKKTLHFIVTLPLMGLVLFASYFRTIQSGYSVLQVISIQKYILAYHKSKFVLPFTVWDLLLFNKWHTWWADRKVLSDPQWTILWPLSVIATAGSLLQGVRTQWKQYTDAEKLLLLWVCIHLTMLSTGYTSSRYFLSLLPILYILGTSFGLKLLLPHFYSRFSKKKTPKLHKRDAS